MYTSIALRADKLARFSSTEGHLISLCFLMIMNRKILARAHLIAVLKVSLGLLMPSSLLLLKRVGKISYAHYRITLIIVLRVRLSLLLLLLYQKLILVLLLSDKAFLLLSVHT